MCLLLLCGPALARSGPPQETSTLTSPIAPVAPLAPIAPLPEGPVDTDSFVELLLAPPAPLPLFGPRFGLVTLDLYQPIGLPSSAPNLLLALGIAREAPDIRLLYHYLPLGTAPSDRAAELLFEGQRQGSFWPLCEVLYRRQELLAPEREQDLLALLSQDPRLHLPAALLRQVLTQKPHQAVLQRIESVERRSVRSAPELWVNGKRLRGAVPEQQLREEIDRQRTRAKDLRARGVPLTSLYEKLREEEDGPAPYGPGSPNLRTGTDARDAKLRVDLSGSPARGPAVAPVVLVLFGSLDSYGTYSLSAVVRDVMQRHPGRARLLFKHLPISAAGQEVATLLSQLAQRSPGDFFRVFDALLGPAASSTGNSTANSVGRRYQLSIGELWKVLRELHLDPQAVSATRKSSAAAQVERDVAEARRLGISYGPALLVNGTLLRGPLAEDRLDEIIRDEVELGLIERLKRTRRAPP